MNETNETIAAALAEVVTHLDAILTELRVIRVELQLATAAPSDLTVRMEREQRMALIRRTEMADKIASFTHRHSQQLNLRRMGKQVAQEMQRGVR